MTNNPQSRIDTLQTGNPKELKMLACIPCKDRVEARHLESFMHKKLNASRVRGEWFKTNGGDLNSALHEFAKMKGISEIYNANQDDSLNTSYKARERKLNREVKALKKALNKSQLDSGLATRYRNKKIKILSDKLVEFGMSYQDIKDLIRSNIDE